jgi:hypothetical protein
MKCPKCGYERTPDETAPAWRCPSCGVAYSKASSHADTRTLVGSASRTTQPSASIDSAADDDKLALAAGGQKIAIYCILLTFVLNAAVRTKAFPPLIVLFFTFILGVYSLLGIVRICSGLDKGQGTKIFFMVCAFVPLANIVTLIYLSMKTTRLLRAAGWAVGLMGVKS